MTTTKPTIPPTTPNWPQEAPDAIHVLVLAITYFGLIAAITNGRCLGSVVVLVGRPHCRTRSAGGHSRVDAGPIAAQDHEPDRRRDLEEGSLTAMSASGETADCSTRFPSARTP